MDKICTSIEESKKLIELGLDVKTADMYYLCGTDLRMGGYKAFDEEFDLPSWSLYALLKLLPRGWKLINSERGDEWNLKCPELMSQVWFKSIFDAVYNTIFYLLENKKL